MDHFGRPWVSEEKSFFKEPDNISTRTTLNVDNLRPIGG